MAAIGFCFGGMVALALARAGEPMAGAISIHGSLGTSKRAQPGAVRARLLVCHGALDFLADIFAAGAAADAR